MATKQKYSETTNTASQIKAAVSEKRISELRLFQAFLIPGIYWLLMDKAGTDIGLAAIVTFTVIAFSLFVLILKPYKRINPNQFAVFAALIDTAVTFTWVYATGGKDSPFFALILITIMAIAFRSGKSFTLWSGITYIAIWGVLFNADEGFRNEAVHFIIDVIFILIFTLIAVVVSGEVYKQTKNILEIKNLSKGLQKNNKYLNILKNTAEAFYFSSSINEAAEKCIETICNEMQWQAGHLNYINPLNTDLISPEIWNRDALTKFPTLIKAIEDAKNKKALPIPELALDECNPVQIEINGNKDLPEADLLQSLDFKTAFAFPVCIKNEIAAVFVFYTTESLSKDDELLSLLGQVGYNFSRVVERIRAEESLKQKNEEIRVIFEKAPDAVIVMDQSGKVLKWNPKAEEIFQWKPSEAIGEYIHNLIIPEEFIESHLKALGDFHETGDSPILNRSIELLAAKKDKTEIHVETSISASVLVYGRKQFIAFIKDITDRKKAQTIEAELAAIVKNSNDAIISLTLEETVVSWNPGAEMVFGYLADEMIGKKITRLMPEASLDEEQKLIEKVKNGLRTEQFETIRKRKDGSLINVSLTVSPIKDTQGNITGSSTIARDITEKKQTEEKLVKFRQALNNSAEDIFIISRDNMRIEDVNEKAIQSTGFSREELLLMRLDEIEPFYNKEELEAKFDEISRSSSKLSVLQTAHRRKDGSDFEVEVYLTPFKYEEKNYFVASARDITERLEAEKKIRETNQFLSTVLENLPVMVFIKSAAYLKFVTLNKIFEEITGLSREGMIGKSDYDFFPKEEADFFVKKDREVLQSGKILEIPEEPIESIHKGRRWLSTIKVPIYDELEKPKYLLGISEDITEKREASNKIKNLNKELTKNLSELEHINKELESFTYSVSHDLRAPLRAINGYAQFLAEDYKSILNDDGKRMLQEVQENAIKMGKLIEDLLEFSKMGRKKVVKNEVNMKNLTEQVINELKTLHEKPVNFIVKELLPAKGDESLLKQVLFNLIGNAVKYSSKSPEPFVKIGSEKKEKAIEYYIKDNGVGFDMEYSGKLFQVFQRLHSDNEFEGTGVGLAIVKKIINRHGGKVWAESEPGKGATFYFSLPEE
ncbi:MAG: PAS domain S-box protein [Bacteroidetes bacterium]|nr:PAS domain S-box protein [Bacteroidota bacterium]